MPGQFVDIVKSSEVNSHSNLHRVIQTSQIIAVEEGNKRGSNNSG